MLSLNNLQNIIYNPIIPYVGTITEQLKPGSLIVIRGHVPKDSERFQVDFQLGNSLKPRADVAFHFNPRFKRSSCIVCNTLTQEKWGWEEITYDMPFRKEKSFEIVFMVLKNKFQVAVNGRHVLLYAHRISPEQIDTVGIYGKVNIHSIGFRFSSASALPHTLGVRHTRWWTFPFIYIVHLGRKEYKYFRLVVFCFCCLWDLKSQVSLPDG